MAKTLEQVLNELQSLKRNDEYEIKVFIEHADPQKMVEEGLRYLAGDGVSRDAMKTYIYMNASIAKGSSDACFYLGKMYTGWFFYMNIPLSIKYLELAIERGHILAHELLGDIYYRATPVRDYKKAFEYLSISAVRGYSHSINMVGVMYLRGQYVAQDNKKAQEMFEIGRKRKDSVAINNLGLIYELQGNLVKAFEMYQEAANMNCVFGNYNLSRAHKNGIGTQVDLEKYKIYRARAAIQGHQDARREIMIDQIEEEKAEQEESQRAKLQKAGQKIETTKAKKRKLEETSESDKSIAAASEASKFSKTTGGIEVSDNEAVESEKSNKRAKIEHPEINRSEVHGRAVLADEKEAENSLQQESKKVLETKGVTSEIAAVNGVAKPINTDNTESSANSALRLPNNQLNPNNPSIHQGMFLLLKATSTPASIPSFIPNTTDGIRPAILNNGPSIHKDVSKPRRHIKPNNGRYPGFQGLNIV